MRERFELVCMEIFLLRSQAIVNLCCPLAPGRALAKAELPRPAPAQEPPPSRHASPGYFE